MLSPAAGPCPIAPPRFLLCACPAHCAQVLRAAAAARVPLHGLHPSCDWPPPAFKATPWPADSLVLWALLAQPSAAQQAREDTWRQTLLYSPQAVPLAVHMLYGQAAQQAQQLMPWVPPGRVSGTGASSTHQPDNACYECLDAGSEQALFAHLRTPRTA